MTALPHRQGYSPASRCVPTRGARAMGGGPPGNAGVPPACYPVAYRSVSLRCGTRPPCRRELHGLGRSRVLAPAPVDPGGGNARGFAKTCAGGTPALPGGLHSLTPSQQSSFIGVFMYLRLVFKNDLQFLPRRVHPPPPIPPTGPRPVPARSGSPSPACRAGSRACAGCA